MKEIKTGVCILCQSNNKSSEYGEFMSSSNIEVHYYCLLFSSNLIQNGDDNEGLLGFMPSDIRAESQRVKQQVCYYCKKKSANVGCCHPKCHKTFHFICGIEKGAINQFLDTFRSFCDKHLPILNKLKPKLNDECIVCYMKFIMPENRKLNFTMNVYHKCGPDILRFFHKNCLQKYANSSGYFFKCPVCNDSNEMCRNNFKMQGIFIPDRDAEWETCPGAFSELEERPRHCVAIKCLCAHGNSSKTEIDELEICINCGSKAIHKICKLDKLPFSCSECNQILRNEKIRMQTSSSEDEVISIDSDDEVISIDSDVIQRKRKLIVPDEDFYSSDDEVVLKKLVQKRIKLSSPKQIRKLEIRIGKVNKNENTNNEILSRQVSKNYSFSLDIQEQIQLDLGRDSYVKSKIVADNSNNQVNSNVIKKKSERIRKFSDPSNSSDEEQLFVNFVQKSTKFSFPKKFKRKSAVKNRRKTKRKNNINKKLSHQVAENSNNVQTSLNLKNDLKRLRRTTRKISLYESTSSNELPPINAKLKSSCQSSILKKDTELKKNLLANSETDVKKRNINTVQSTICKNDKAENIINKKINLQVSCAKSKIIAENSNNVQTSLNLQNDLKSLRRTTRSMSLYESTSSNELPPINAKLKSSCQSSILKKDTEVNNFLLANSETDVQKKNINTIQSTICKNDKAEPLSTMLTNNFAGSNKNTNFIKTIISTSIEEERNQFMAKLKLRPVNQCIIQNYENSGLMNLKKFELKKIESKFVQLKLNGDKINNKHLLNGKFENDKWKKQANRKENLTKKKGKRIEAPYLNDIRQYFKF